MKKMKNIILIFVLKLLTYSFLSLLPINNKADLFFSIVIEEKV
jgi:hypothetical protein